MSGGLDVMALNEEDARKMLAASTNLGSENLHFQMKTYVYKRRSDGIHVINLRRTWEKLMLAARAVVAIENPADVFVISSRPFGQRAALKFAAHTGATLIAGRFTPGAFTNQTQAAFREPRLLVVLDPAHDHQPITEASYVNIPVIAFCNTDSPLRYVDIAIPCNTKAIVTPKPLVPASVHEDWSEPAEPVSCWADKGAAVPVFGAPALSEDWAAQVQDEWGTTAAAPAPVALAPPLPWGGTDQDWSAA